MLKRLVHGVSRRLDSSHAYRWLKWRLRRPRLPTQGPVRLHLGCGQVDLPGFINIDAAPYSHVHLVGDIGAPDLWPPGTADMIYASHVLEHVEWARVPLVLARWHRMLKQGGVLRLSVPDFDALVEYYTSTKDLAWITAPLMGGQSNEHDYHRAVFTSTSLEDQLRQAGFSDVRRWQPDASTRDWSAYRFKVDGCDRYLSVNLEGVK